MVAILITGANRGIGLGLVKAYVANPNTTVIAGVRDIANSNSLKGVKLGSGSNIIIVKLDSASRTDAKAAVEEIKGRHGISRLDIVIANAGIGKYWGTVLESPPEEFLDHYNINVIGLVILFQATWPLLEAVASPKFVVITSAIGSISAMEQIPLPDAAYGVSKTAANFVTRKLHFEHEKLLVVPIHPGWVQTDMGTAAALTHGMAEAPVTLQDSINGLISKIDGVTPKTSGSFFSFDDAKYGW